MIFVTTGMGTAGFRRLIEKMDWIAGIIDEEVVIQIGSSKYQPKNASYFTFKDSKEVRKIIKEARLIVCHGGAGTIISAIEMGKHVIAVPRLKQYSESPDDHQTELVDALADKGRIVAVYDMEDMMGALNNPLPFSPTRNEPDKRLVNRLRDYINGLSV